MSSGQLMFRGSCRKFHRISILASILHFGFVSSFGTLRMSSSSSSGSSNASSMPVIDSHLHVWASASESQVYPYAANQIPPESLQNAASVESLLDRMKEAGVDGTLIVQPINHKFDHSYVARAIEDYPEKFKGMLLHDPGMAPDEGLKNLEDLLLQGFVGVRFNPYLWPEGKLMSDVNGMQIYKRCGELKMPVGIMCFKGLHLHYDDIVRLLEASPETVCILDHFGFTGFSDQGDANFAALLRLQSYPNVVVKISALFRIGGDADPFPYERVRKERFLPLLEAFGADRLMFGTDFPFVLEMEGAYKGAVQTVSSWCSSTDVSSAVMGGTASRVFGAWLGGPKVKG